MPIRRLLWMVLAVLALAGPALVLPVEAQAAPGVSKKKSKKKRARGKFVGRSVPKSELRTEPLPTPSGRVVVFSRNVHEKADVNIYNADGSFNQAALATLDRVFRCRRTGEERAMDPRLYEILSILYDRYEKPIEINSGFRYQRNEGSRHFHASAMDVQIAGVSQYDLYKFATKLDAGGMGIGRYPHNGFVHIDYRAPGEPSYRWTDTYRGRRNSIGKAPSRMWRRTRPNT